jgi:hypothetical protein
MIKSLVSPPGSWDPLVYAPAWSCDSPVLNIWEVNLNWFRKKLLLQTAPGTQDAPVINTLASLYSLVKLLSEVFLYTCPDACSEHTKKSAPRCIHHRRVETPQCIHHRRVETPRCFHHREVRTPQCICHRGVKTPNCIHHRGVTLDALKSFYRF